MLQSTGVQYWSQLLPGSMNRPDAAADLNSNLRVLHIYVILYNTISTFLAGTRITGSYQQW